jgi:hypothetical protein
MLKAAIVYVQGSGGNLLARTLSLSEQTVAYLPVELSAEQPTKHLSAAERIKLYNNWNSTDWTSTEKNLTVWYRHGLQDFYHYENTDLWLIDQFHPTMFKSELDKQVLFKDITSWEHLIFIKYKQSSLDTIIKLSKLKRRDLDHQQQIKKNELVTFNKLINIYPMAHSVCWEDFLEEDSFIKAITDLSNKINLILNYSLVKELWNSWKKETEKILNERS